MKGERNYHVFYMVCKVRLTPPQRAATPEEGSRYYQYPTAGLMI